MKRFGVMVVSLWICSSIFGEESPGLRIEGSTVIGALAKGFADQYREAHSDASIEVEENGSSLGVRALINGECRIAMCSRFLREVEFAECVSNGIMPTAHCVAIEAVSVIVHPSNTVSNLTINQLRKIYAGEVSNWNELGGADLSIIPIHRDSNCGNYECFTKLMGDKLVDNAVVQWASGGGAERAYVQQEPGAIAYVLPWMIDKSVRAVQIEGVTPTEKNIRNGTYPMVRNLYFFTNGFPERGTPSFWLVTHHLTDQGARLLREIGYIPVFDMSSQ
ncbi:MAG: phosphate ABC transporter substrate-binding protein [Pontiellaceae bacterium]|nr:phosphate ABC transporter substrate-binding protein [Pontiellaceae bacterium]